MSHDSLPVDRVGGMAAMSSVGATIGVTRATGDGARHPSRLRPDERSGHRPCRRWRPSSFEKSAPARVAVCFPVDVDARSRADELIEDANAFLQAGRVHNALPLYREAATLFPRYASFELVAADQLYRLGRREEAAESYRRVVEGVPEHDQAWHSLALVLYELGHVDEADQAMRRSNALEAELKYEGADDLVQQYRAATDIDQRAGIAEQLLHSLDDGAAEALHDFLRRSRTERPAPGRDFAGLQASILVRFGMADFVYWYSDGPAPDRALIAADIDRYLAAHRRPPPSEHQLPIVGTPPLPSVRRHRYLRQRARVDRSTPSGRLRRLVGRFRRTRT